VNRGEQASIEAADWLVAQADGPLPAEEQARFDAWLAASDGNKAAYWRIELGWQEADRVAALGLAPAERKAVASSRPRIPAWIPAAIAASIVLAVGIQQWAGWGGSASHREPTAESPARSYATSVGQTQLVGLVDGSRIQLNTGSKVRARIGNARREVWLEEGEAYFEVAREEDRPFVVHAGDREITVLGTRFAVRRTNANVIVTVIEGRVRLAQLEGGRTVRSAIVSGGDIAVAAGAATLVTSRSEEVVEQALSWRDGVLTFDQQPLSAIADEFNRYNGRRLVLADPSTGSIRITGTFPADRPDAFARLLREAYGLGFEESGQEIRIHR
jgi:transmembrane sensor